MKLGYRTEKKNLISWNGVRGEFIARLKLRLSYLIH
jgi:hypothetical protein